MAWTFELFCTDTKKVQKLDIAAYSLGFSMGSILGDAFLLLILYYSTCRYAISGRKNVQTCLGPPETGPFRTKKLPVYTNTPPCY